MYMSRGLSFEFGSGKIDIFSGFVLDGTQWMVRRGRIDAACRGREISRPNNGRSSSFIGALNRLAALETNRKSEFQDFIDHIEENNDGALAGHKHFWRSDFTAQRRQGYYASLKMCSNRMNGTEYMNNENKKGYYVPFGTTMIMVSGDEYFNIYPIWDWARIPGVTSPYKSSLPNMPTYIKGTTDFAGGASNGKYGAAGFDLDWDGVTGKKAWFYFEHEFVALGAGITSTGMDPVYTSINQCWLKDTVWSGSAGAAGKPRP
jgi:chondroitin AC lyase